MVKVSIEVRSGVARFAVGVRTRSARRAMSLGAGRYPDAGVMLLNYPESSTDHATRAGTVAAFEMAA